ncbi:MAG: DUF4065 domain-containing protein [Eubacteriales bacterium]|nr:DUF4065 domain-containing protein [Eubacteriales bacterium]
MKILKNENKLCLSCLTEHQVDTVEIVETGIFRDQEIEFSAIYEYCHFTDEYNESEEIIRRNNCAAKDNYRKRTGLLTSKEIVKIREKYGISQKDLSEILGWGMATIARYEAYQVQDRAHDDILRKIDVDPKWLLELLTRNCVRLSAKAHNKYFYNVSEQYAKNKNFYLVESIQAIYANFTDKIITGFTDLDLDKVVEVINYLADRVSNLHKVKLMKLLWYPDFLHFKRYKKSITGLAYSALPLGAVPEGYEQIVLLEGVNFDTLMYDENIAYKFKPTPGFNIKKLTVSETAAIDKIINETGHLSTEQIVKKMHDEEAYKCTPCNGLISYKYADLLSID